MPEQYTWKDGRWTDSKGNPVDASVIAGMPLGQTPDVPSPSSLGDAALKGIGKLAPRVATQVGGTEAGAALGALIPGAEPVTVPLGAMIGGALGNYAGSKLPPAIGGNPQESAASSLLWGGLPEGIARGLGGYLENKALTKGAEAAHSSLVGSLGEPPSGAEQSAKIAQVLGRSKADASGIPQALGGTKLTDATNALRDPVLSSINRQRRALGEPIGKAYDALKGSDVRISEQEAGDLADAARNVQDSLISPAPGARSALARVKSYQPPAPAAPFTPDAAFFRATPEQQQAIMDAAKGGSNYQPPTLDEIRELRQGVNTSLRGAKGGDAHVLLNLQQALDEKLMPHLPDNIGRSRQLYAGFIRRFPWRDTNQIRQMGTPREISQYVFGGGPERAQEIIAGAGTDGRQTIKDAFTDHLLGSVDPDAPPEAQVKQIQKTLMPYQANGTARRLYGGQNADELRDIISAPVHRQRMAQLMAQPAQKEAFTQGWKTAVKNAKPGQIQAAEAGMQKFYDSLPPAEQRYFQQPIVPGAQLPVLPSTQQALTEGLQPGKSNMGYLNRRAQFTAPYAMGRMAMGGGGAAYGMANALAFASMATGSAAYRAIMENGGAGALAKLYAAKNGGAAARLTLESLASMGAQAGQRATTEDDDAASTGQ